MRFLAGTWSRSVKSSRRPAAFHETVSTSFSSDGYWMLTRTVTEKVPWNPIEITRDDRITYDPTTVRWIDLGTDDYGLYDVSTSRGWNGNSITWADLVYPKSHAVKANNPLVFRKLSDRKTESITSLVEPSGRVVSVVTRCSRV